MLTLDEKQKAKQYIKMAFNEGYDLKPIELCKDFVKNLDLDAIINNYDNLLEQNNKNKIKQKIEEFTNSGIKIIKTKKTKMILQKKKFKGNFFKENIMVKVEKDIMKLSKIAYEKNINSLDMKIEIDKVTEETLELLTKRLDEIKNITKENLEIFKKMNKEIPIQDVDSVQVNEIQNKIDIILNGFLKLTERHFKDMSDKELEDANIMIDLGKESIKNQW